METTLVIALAFFGAVALVLAYLFIGMRKGPPDR